VKGRGTCGSGERNIKIWLLGFMMRGSFLLILKKQIDVVSSTLQYTSLTSDQGYENEKIDKI
jgi:hypothetical protein